MMACRTARGGWSGVKCPHGGGPSMRATEGSNARRRTPHPCTAAQRAAAAARRAVAASSPVLDDVVGQVDHGQPLLLVCPREEILPHVCHATRIPPAERGKQNSARWGGGPCCHARAGQPVALLHGSPFCKGAGTSLGARSEQRSLILGCPNCCRRPLPLPPLPRATPVGSAQRAGTSLTLHIIKLQ